MQSLLFAHLKARSGQYVVRVMQALMGLFLVQSAMAAGTVSLTVNGSSASSISVAAGSTITLNATISAYGAAMTEYFYQNGSVITQPGCQNGGVGSVSCTLSNVAAGTYVFTDTTIFMNNPAMGPTWGTTNVTSNAITVTVTPAQQVILHPKFIVLGVTYAPPGASSYVQYSQTNAVGTTLTDSASYTRGTTTTVSLSAGGSLFSVVSGKVTATSATGSSQKTTNGTSTTVTNTQLSSYKLGGFTIAPTSYTPTITHNYDTIWVWLNPVSLYQVSAPGNITFNGFGYDGDDPVGGMDVVAVQVGELNGAFPMSPSTQHAMSRSWEQGVTYGPGMGAALTQADYNSIVAVDPFTNSSYTIGSGATVSSDGRFTRTTPNLNGYATQTISYTPGTLTETFTNTYQNASSITNGTTNTYQTSFGVDVSVSASLFASFSASLGTKYQQTWENVTNSQITSTNTVADTVSITAPPTTPTYYGPTAFEVYQDNAFGTFMFNPIY